MSQPTQDDLDVAIAMIAGLPDCNERDAVLSNLRDNKYTRLQDVHADVADVLRRARERAAEDERQAQG